MKSGNLQPERMAGAAVWRLAFLAIQGGGSVVLFSALGHALDRETFAATAVALGVIVLAQVIGDFGFSQAAVTVLPARIAARPQDEADLLSGAAAAYGAAATLGLVLTLAGVALVPSAARGPVAVSAPAAAAAVLVAGADGLLRSRGDFRRPILLMTMSEGAGFAGLPIAILTGSALWTCAAISAGMTLGATASVVVLVRLHRRGAHPHVRAFARASAPLGLSQVLIVLGTRADTLIAGGLSGLIAAGTFEGTWRVYQLTQYVAGGLATAAAPFIADGLGAGRIKESMRLLRTLMVRLAVVGTVAGALMYFARDPIAGLLTGSLSGSVATALLPFALLSPLTAVTFAAFYTLISQDGQRRYVLGVTAIAAVVNIVLATGLAPANGARGVVTACAIGLTVTDVLLLVRLAAVVRSIRAEQPGQPLAAGELVQRSQ